MVGLGDSNSERTENEELGFAFVPFLPVFFGKFGRPKNGLLEITEFLRFGETPSTILGDETRERFSILLVKGNLREFAAASILSRLRESRVRDQRVSCKPNQKMRNCY